jgi:hypothetical protein
MLSRSMPKQTRFLTLLEGVGVTPYVLTGFVAEGDSLTIGGYGETISYPTRLALRTGWNLINRGHGGDKLLAIDTAFNTDVVPYYNAANANTLLFLAATNDLFASETLANLQAAALSVASKASVFKRVWWLTVPPSSFITGGAETTRLAYNAWLKTQFAGRVIDIASITEAADPANTEYFVDGTHPQDKLIVKEVDLVVSTLGLTDLLVSPAFVNPAFGGTATFANSNARTTLTSAKATVRNNTPIKGKKVFSATLVTDGGFVTGVGFTNLYASPTETIGQDVNRSVCYFGNGSIWRNNATADGAAAFTTGAQIDVVVDETNALCWFSTDGVSYYGTGGTTRTLANVVAGVGGYDWSAVKANGTVYPAVGSIITANSVWNTAAPRTIPSGYTRLTT